MVVTCPGPMMPSRCTSPASRIARVAGGVSLCRLKTKKLSSFSCSARRIEAAIVGAVVSKPTPSMATGLSGFLRARSSASRLE